MSSTISIVLGCSHCSQNSSVPLHQPTSTAREMDRGHCPKSERHEEPSAPAMAWPPEIGPSDRGPCEWIAEKSKLERLLVAGLEPTKQ